MTIDPTKIAAEIESLFLQSRAPRIFELSKSGKVPKSELLEIADNILKISAFYNNERPRSGFIMETRSLATAYALYYGTINSAKVAHLLNQTKIPVRPLKILDFGSGPGTSTLTLIKAGCNIQEIIAVDPSIQMLETFRDSVKTQSPGLRFMSYRNLSELSDSSFDLIFCCNVLNEIDGTKHLQTIERLTSWLCKGATLLILEPGSFHATRSLMALRNKIAEFHKEMEIIYPCTHHLECPMLSEEGQWCHASLHWHRPPIVQQLDELTGFNKHEIKFSALMLQKTPRQISSHLRVIREPVKTKMGFRIGICGQSQYGEVIIDPKKSPLERKTLKNLKLHSLLSSL